VILVQSWKQVERMFELSCSFYQATSERFEEVHGQAPQEIVKPRHYYRASARVQSFRSVPLQANDGGSKGASFYPLLENPT